MDFEFIDRPEKNHHKRPLKYDPELQSALLKTRENGKAALVPLARFHSSPAKGRIWQKGYHVRHRVLLEGDYLGAWVAAWVEKDEPEPEPELVNGLLPLGTGGTY